MFYVTFPNKEEAVKLSNYLVQEKLVACSNIHTMESCFHWKGILENETEWVAIYKTSHANTNNVEKTIEKRHPYEVPCILHWEFSCNLAYEKWLRKNIVE